MAGGDIIRPQMKQVVVEDELEASIVDFLVEGMNFLAVAAALI